MHYTPLFLAFSVPSIVICVLSCKVKSSIFFFFARGAERWTAGLCHRERLNTVITLSSPWAQHSPSHRQQVPVFPNQSQTHARLQRQTGNSSLICSICRSVSNVNVQLKDLHTGHNIELYYIGLFTMSMHGKHWPLIKLPHELKCSFLDHKQTCQSLKMELIIKIVHMKRLNQNVLNQSRCSAIKGLESFLFMWPVRCKYSEPALKPEEINDHIVHIFSASHLLSHVSDSFPNPFPDRSGLSVQ